jgi:hypothetical protein
VIEAVVENGSGANAETERAQRRRSAGVVGDGDRDARDGGWSVTAALVQVVMETTSVRTRMRQGRSRAVVVAAVLVLELRPSAPARVLQCAARRAGTARGLCCGARGDT